ncbi:MAG: uracil-DNA glycosylase family protein [Capsulimonas sp.]|uniref:uracil-DNA glycosylase n=1 Tax=Capsulimonas sp. TaxID=2494211 RepID=UPI003267E3E8
MLEIEVLHEEIRTCRRCFDDGFPITPGPMVWGLAPAPVMIIGQAPGLTDLRGARMYLGPAARKLFGWLEDAGFAPEDIGKIVYMTALTKCFPGRLPGKSTDRAPSPREMRNCRPWLDTQMALVQPKLIILFGKMAIDKFLPKMLLTEAIGQAFPAPGVTYVPLPHSSGASTWLNDPAHRALLAEAIERVREERLRVLGIAASGDPLEERHP